jgi:hypothetical protein
MPSEQRPEDFTLSYVSLTDPEVRELALGIMAGTVFTDRQLLDPQDITMVFPVLSMMTPEQYQESVIDVVLPGGIEDAAPVGLIYEHLDKAGPRSVNGYPMFFSLRVMSPSDLERVQGVMDELGAVLGVGANEEE